MTNLHFSDITDMTFSVGSVTRIYLPGRKDVTDNCDNDVVQTFLLSIYPCYHHFLRVGALVFFCIFSMFMYVLCPLCSYSWASSLLLN